MVDPARPHEPQRHIFIRQDVSRAEVIGGITWLAVAAAVSVLLEVVYLSAWVSLPGGVQVPVPYTILLAGALTWCYPAPRCYGRATNSPPGCPCGCGWQGFSP